MSFTDLENRGEFCDLSQAPDGQARKFPECPEPGTRRQKESGDTRPREGLPGEAEASADDGECGRVSSCIWPVNKPETENFSVISLGDSNIR